jgi:predicted MFS family arabinose efflux permease
MTTQSREEFRIIACLFFVLFIGVADNQILSPLLPAIRSQFGKSSSDMGFLFTGYSLTAGLFVLVWGPLSDIFGRKPGLLTGLILFGAGACISYAAADFATLLAGRILTGMGACMVSLNAISYAADFFPYAKRGWAMGAIFSSYFAALILGLPLGSWFGEKSGWNSVFGAIACAALALFISVLLLLPSSRKSCTVSEFPAMEFLRQYLGFIRARSSLGALLSSLFASAGTTGFLAFLGVWLHDSYNVSGGKVGLVFLVCGSASLIASPFAGLIADRIGKRRQFILSNISMAMFLFVLPNLSWGPALFAVFGLISLSAAFRQGPMEAVLTEIVPSTSRGTFVALKNSFSQLGTGVAAMLSGILFEHAGYGAVCFLGAISNLLAAGGMLLTLRESRL